MRVCIFNAPNLKGRLKENSEENSVRALWRVLGWGDCMKGAYAIYPLSLAPFPISAPHFVFSSRSYTLVYSSTLGERESPETAILVRGYKSGNGPS